MTIPIGTHRERRVHPLPPGDPGRITSVTRIIWVTQDSMPAHKNAVLAVEDVTGETIILIREGLAPTLQRAEVRRLQAELRKLGASRLAAWSLIAAVAGLRRFGWPYLRLRTSGNLSAAMNAVAEHAGAAAVGTAVVVGAGVTAAGMAASGGGPGGIAYGSPRWHQEHPVHVTLPDRPLSYLGAYEAASPANYTGMETFARTCGRQPNLALYYSGWEERFQMAFARQAASHGAIPLVQIDPVTGAGPGTPGAGVSLAAIAAGSYDAYLTSFADQVATYGQAVVIGFGHEMNGNWYPWGYQHQSATDFVAAWQHIVNIFRRQGADNVTWLWTVNRVSPLTGPLDSYWPGASYVTWIGVDGYYQQTDDTWSSVFAPTIAAVKRFSSAPVLISETAIGPVGTEPWQLSDIFASERQKKYLGLVWFDENKSAYLSYRLEGDPKDAAVFRQETAAWRHLVHQRGAK